LVDRCFSPATGGIEGGLTAENDQSTDDSRLA